MCRKIFIAAFLLAVTAEICSLEVKAADNLPAETVANQAAFADAKTSSGTKAFSGKKLAVFGNSITAARNSWAFRVRDSLGFSGFYNGSVGSSVWGRRVRPEGIAQNYGDPDFAGIGNSSHPSAQARNNNCAVVHIQKFLAEKPDFIPDIIILSYGTNDRLAEEREPALKEVIQRKRNSGRHHNENLSADDAFGLTGGMAWCLQSLVAKFPEARIIVLSPIQANTGLDKYRDKNSDNLLKMKTMRKLCRIYGVEFVDCYHNCGIDASNVEKVLLDGLHPNAAGQSLHASYIISRLVGSRH